MKVGDKSKSINRIPREDNYQVDLISKLASSKPVDFPTNVWVKVLEKPNVGEEELVAFPINIKKDYRTPIMHYLLIDELPSNKNKFMHLTKRGVRYCIIDNILYRRYVSTPLLKCLSP
jgi:hypothetical protein